MKIKDLKLQTLREQGDSLAKLGNLELDEYPLLEKNNGNFIIDTLNNDTNIIQITNSGYIRKIKLKELISNRRKINYYPLSKKEEVVYSCIENSNELILITKKNKNIKIKLKDIDIFSKKQKGTKLKLDKDDLIEFVK